MRFMTAIHFGFFGFSLPAFAGPPPNYDIFLARILQEQPEISRQVLRLKAAEEQVRASGNFRAMEFGIRGGSTRISEDDFVDVIEVEFSRPFPGQNRVRLAQSLASMEVRRENIELERLARNLSLDLRSDLLSLWRLTQVISSLEEQRMEWERILQTGGEMASAGHLPLRELQPYRLSLLQVQREIRSLTREKQRQEHRLEQWAGEHIPSSGDAAEFLPPDHTCTPLENLTPVRAGQLEVELAEAFVLAALYSGREEPRIGVFVEHEREGNGESGQMAGLFYSVSLPYRAESHQRRAAQYHQDAAREALRGIRRELGIERLGIQDEIETVRESLKDFETDLLPQALAGVADMDQAVGEGRVSPLNPAFTRLEVLLLKRERIEDLHRLYLLQIRAHQWCGADHTSHILGGYFHDSF